MENKRSLRDKVFSKRVYKFLLFLISYSIAVMVTVLLLLVIHPSNIEEGGGVLGSFVIGLGWFPLGSPFAILTADIVRTPTFPNSLSLIVGWLIYLMIVVWATFSKNKRTTQILFYVFVFLLLLNIGGCIVTQ